MLATDGMETYAIFLYADGEIQWTTGDADGGTNGLGETLPRMDLTEEMVQTLE